MKNKKSTTAKEFYIIFEKDNGEVVEIEVAVRFYIFNDGIGPYEYWGHRGFDAGKTCVDVEEVSWDKTGFSEKEVKEVEERIDKDLDHWIEEI